MTGMLLLQLGERALPHVRKRARDLGRWHGSAGLPLLLLRLRLLLLLLLLLLWLTLLRRQTAAQSCELRHLLCLRAHETFVSGIARRRRLLLLLPLIRSSSHSLLLLVRHRRLGLHRRARSLRMTLLRWRARLPRLTLLLLLLACLLPLLLLHMICINLAHLIELVLKLADPAQEDGPALLRHTVEHLLVVSYLHGRPEVCLDPHHLVR